MKQILDKQQVKAYSEQVLNHFLSLSKEDLWLRFMQSKNEYSIREWWNTMLDNDQVSHRFVLFWDNDEVIALGQISRVKHARSGEISISVSPSHRGNKLAHGLFNELLSIAQQSRIDDIILVCSHQNKSIIHIAKKLGFIFSVVEGDYYAVKTV